MEALQIQLVTQDLAERHADTMRELGRPFSGVRMCGICVELIVNDRFTVDGSFLYGSSDDVIIVLNECDLINHFGALVWKWDACGGWKWDGDILEEWGAVKCNDTRARMLAWYRDDPYRPDNPSTDEVGAGPSHHREAFHTIYEAALKSRHQGLLAVGRTGVAVTKSCGIGKAVAIMEAVATDLNCKEEMNATFSIFRICARLRPLALALLVEGNSSCNAKRKAAWMALPDLTKKNLVLEQWRMCTFFTRDRLARCR